MTYEVVRYHRQIESQVMVATPLIDAATTAWVAAVVANGGSVSTGRKTLVNSLIAGLKADGVFRKLDRLWLFAAENAASALTDIVAASLASAVGSPAFTADDGYSGGANQYIDGNFDPSTAGGNYTEPAAHVSVWQYSNAPNLGGSVGSKPAAQQNVRCYLPYVDNNLYWRLNYGDTDEVSAVAPDAQGLWVGTSTNAAVSATMYRNAASIATAGAHPTQLPTGILFLSNSITGLDWYTDIVSAGGFGGSLTAGEVTSLYNRLRTYMTAVGVP